MLKPGETLRFIEHVRVDGVYGCLQNLLTPMWRRIAGDCHLTRRTVEVVVASGFTVEAQGTDRPFVSGIATRVDS